MQRPVEEGEESRHPAESNQAIPTRDAAQRCECQRGAQEPQRPDAGFVGEIGERIGAEMSGQRGPHQPRERPERCEENERLENEPERAIGYLHHKGHQGHKA